MFSQVLEGGKGKEVSLGVKLMEKAEGKRRKPGSPREEELKNVWVWEISEKGGVWMGSVPCIPGRVSK